MKKRAKISSKTILKAIEDALQSGRTHVYEK